MLLQSKKLIIASKKHKHNNTSLKKGFSLIELAIVLVIIGILAGTVTVGYVLVDQSQLKESIALIERHNNSMNLFQDKYFSLPGDMPHASRFWQGARDGNGDEQISWQGNLREDITFWNHLYRADITSYNYQGNVDLGHALSTNIPKSKLDNGGYVVMTSSIYRDSGLFMQLASVIDNEIGGALISPSNAMSIDRKIDDGLADSGDIYSSRGSNINTDECTTSTMNQSANSDYIIGNDAKTCRMFFWINKD